MPALAKNIILSKDLFIVSQKRFTGKNLEK
jgi:hypothetical protein